jgi:hypothetical protein
MSFFPILIIIYIIKSIICRHYPLFEKINKSKRGKIRAIDIESYETYLDYIKNHEYVVSYFHSDFCPECEEFLPIFDEASTYKILNKKWVFLKLDCARNSHVCMNNGIDQFPYSEIYRNSEIVDAELPNDVIALLELLYKLSTDPIVHIKTKEEFFKNYGYYSPIVEVDKLPVEKGTDKKDLEKDDEDDKDESIDESDPNNEETDDFYKCIKKIANEDFLKTFYFGIMETKDYKEKIVFDNDGYPVTHLWDGICQNAIDFLNQNKYPLLHKVDRFYLKELDDDPRLLFTLVTFPENEKIKDLIVSSYKKLAFKYRQYAFGYVDFNEDQEVFNDSIKIVLNNTDEIQFIINDFIDRSHYVHKPVFDIENQTDVEIIAEIEKLILNVTNLKFETGSRIQDFINKLGINKMNSTQQVILIIVMIIFLIILVYFCGNPEDLDDDEYYEYEEVDTSGKEKSS